MEIKILIDKITHSQNFRHGMLYTLFSFLNNGISFILVLILARFLQPSDYGQLNLFNTFVTLLNIVISLSTASFVAVSFFSKNKDDIQKIITIVIAVSSSISVFLSLLFICFPKDVENLLGVDIRYLWLGILICFFSVFNNLNLDIWRLEEKPVIYGIYSLSFALCNFGLTFWLIVGEKLGWSGRVYAWFLLGLLYFLISIIFLYKRKYLTLGRPSEALIKETLLFALPLLPHNVSFWLKQGADRYIINYFYDTTVVGYFSFSMNMAAIITMIVTAFNATNSVYSFKILSANDAFGLVKLFTQAKIMTVVFLLVCIGVWGFAFCLIIFGIPKYSNSIPFLVPLCMGAFFQCIYYLWVNYIIFYKKTHKLMMITLGTAIIQICLSIWLARFSPLNIAWVSMGISALTFILVYFTSHNILKHQDIMKSLTLYYDNRKNNK